MFNQLKITFHCQLIQHKCEKRKYTDRLRLEKKKLERESTLSKGLGTREMNQEGSKR